MEQLEFRKRCLEGEGRGGGGQQKNTGTYLCPTYFFFRREGEGGMKANATPVVQAQKILLVHKMPSCTTFLLADSILGIR